MNDIIKALIQAGGAVGALGMLWLIIKALVPLFSKAYVRDANGNKELAAGQMAKSDWILIFNGLFDEKLKPFQEKHEHLVDRLDKMAEGFQANRQIIIDKLDKLAETMHRKGRQ